MNERPSFILAGNGAYENRGCEAIIRGTVKILRRSYKDPSFLCVNHFQNQEQFIKQRIEEQDKTIIHKKTYRNRYKIFSPKWAFQFVKKRASPSKYINEVYKEMFPTIKAAEAVLSIGGDNYSLDYGIPELFTGLDDLTLRNRKPIIIWGASIGPFDRIPKYERYMKKHLQHVTGIFARESATIKYLKSIGINENVYEVADPAFLMEASEPQLGKKIELERESIGINLSPLMAKYVSNGNIELWTSTASQLIKNIAKETDNKIYLIPHVTNSNSNDYLFLKEIEAKINIPKENIFVIPPVYNASETKWIISKMKFFAGSRTHSTIAALSSHVPTLSFAYSIKAKGINKDVFGHEDYCMSPEKLNPKLVAEKIILMLDENKKIKSELRTSIPKVEKKAISAGEILQGIIG
jgi:polysaccharide pyruvyl transferase WcaK-like protein